MCREDNMRRPSITEGLSDAVEVARKQPTVAETVRTEVRLLLELAVPTVFLSLGFCLSPLLTASYVGRKFGAVYLSGFTLANLTGNLSTLSFLQGFYNASDTLSPQAFGARNYKEVGLIAMRGFFASIIILIPICLIMVPFIGPILIACGQDPEAVVYTSKWYRIYSLSLPFYALYMVTWKFLSAQHVMKPLVYVLFFCCACVLPLSLEILTWLMGFLGSAVAFFIYQSSEAVLLLLFLWWKQPYEPRTWPGLGSWRQALSWEPLKTFFLLGLGGMLANTEWIFWEAQGLIVGTLGVTPLAVHTIPTQVIMITFMPPYGIGVALSIRMGVTLSTNVRRAQALVAGTIVASILLFGFLTILMYAYRDFIFAVFTTDPDVLEGAHAIWVKVCLSNLNMSLFAVLAGIATGLGMQWTLGIVNCVSLFLVGIPAIYYFALVQGGGLQAAWTWINAPYVFMNIALSAAFIRKNWHDVSAEIQKREAMNLETELESQSLLNVPVYGAMDERNGSTATTKL